MSKEVSRKEASKRDKYTSQACFECQRRKIKCSGESVCSSCRTRCIECRYARNDQHDMPKQKKHARKESIDETSCPWKRNKVSMSVTEQLSQLQEKVNTLFQNQTLNNTDIQSATTEQLCNRTLSDLGQSPNMYMSDNNSLQNWSFGGSCSPQGIRSPLKTIKEPETLSLTSSSSNKLPIRSQINALKKLRRSRDVTEPEDSSQSMVATVDLPEPSCLWHLVNTFFQEFESYFPFLNHDALYERLSTILTLRGYTQENQQIVFGSDNSKIIAILLNMLAYAESLTLPTENGKSQPGSQSYMRGLNLMERFGQLHDNDLETIVYHTTSLAYLLEMEMHHMALESVTKGFRIALSIDLNNQKLWPADDCELASRRGLWWTLYFLDKRITQKCGITYFLRENESAVSDFGKVRDKLDSNKHDVLQSMISFSRLWAHIWDGFYSPQAPKADNWEELQMTDTRIMSSYRQLPSNLHWRFSQVAEYMKTEGEIRIRQRLVVFLRFEFLRLSIRHKPLTSHDLEHERRKSSILICQAIIEAIRSYMITYSSLKPCGSMLATALVESLYHILPEQWSPTPVLPSEVLKEMVHGASELLHTLSNTVATASRAYESLRELLPAYDELRLLRTSPLSRPRRKTGDKDFSSDFSANLNSLSERFWQSVESPERDGHPGSNNLDPEHGSFLPSSTDFLPFELNDDAKREVLMGLDLKDMTLGLPFSLDYSSAQCGGDLL